MIKFRVEVRVPAGTNPEAVAGFIESSVNKTLGGKGACKTKASEPGPFDKPLKEETDAKTIYIDLDLIRNLKTGDSQKFGNAIQSGASARGGRVTNIYECPDEPDHDAVRNAIEGRA